MNGTDFIDFLKILCEEDERSNILNKKTDNNILKDKDLDDALDNILSGIVNELLTEDENKNSINKNNNTVNNVTVEDTSLNKDKEQPVNNITNNNIKKENDLLIKDVIFDNNKAIVYFGNGETIFVNTEDTGSCDKEKLLSMALCLKFLGKERYIEEISRF
jgi:hypothetical protein